MRWIAIVLTASICGCAEIPSYLVSVEHLNAEVAPATRESDGRPVVLRGGSFMPTGDLPEAGGRVRVRGPGRHSAMWKAGLGVTLAGWVLAITGAALGITGFGRTICSDFHSCPPSDYTRAADQMLIGGLIIGPIGDVMTLVGPALMVAGARLKPEELDAP